jgi:phage terminase large subunit-like protein
MVAESNNGGEMVSLTIQTVPGAPFVTLVHASRGKITRAEPIAALSEQKRLHMVGTFPQLEDELTQYDGTGASPNRMDALVWACTELGLHIAPSQGMW